MGTIVKVKPLSFYKDIIGPETIEIEINEQEPTLDKLLDHLQARYPKLSKYRGTPLLNILVNGQSAKGDIHLKDGDEIAIMPIPSGG